MFKKFFIFSLIFFAVAVGYASYMFLYGGNTVSNQNIDIGVSGNTFTAGGEELPLVISITNRNNTALELVDLVVEYPKSSASTAPGEMIRLRNSLGTIPAGSIRNENVKLVLFGEQGSAEPVRVAIEYRVAGSNAIFVKDKTYEVTISSTPINLSVEAPNSASQNENITLKIKSTLNATKGLSKILLKVDYPAGFQFERATPAPSYGDNVWNLGDFAPGTERIVSISGKLVDAAEGEQKSFRIWSGNQSDTDKSQIGVVLNSILETIAIQRAAIGANLSINGEPGGNFAIDPKGRVQAEIRWANNLDTRIDDMQIRVKLSGNALDEKSVQADQGFYDSGADTIMWDKNYDNDLAEINPGDSGSVTFSLEPIAMLSASSVLVGDPTINIEVSITGKQEAGGYAAEDLASVTSASVRIITDPGLSAKALYYSWPFKNTGPIPPQAEKQTTYTVTWSVSNTTNNVSGAKVTSTLPPWADWSGRISPSGENLVYNSSTKEITWSIGQIPKGTGVTKTGRSASFQILLTPSLSQVGTAPVILNDSILTGHDDFANVDVRVNRASLYTRLSGDPSFPDGGDRVVE